MADVNRLVRVGIVPPQALELADQINAVGADKPQIAALTTITTIDAIDPATTMAMANECKAKVNAIIAALQA